MKLNQLKRIFLVGGSVSLTAVIPIALVACGDDGITQANVDAEQLVINALGGTKNIDVSTPIGLATNATFTANVAKSFNITGFTPKSGYKYTYDQTALAKDGTFFVTITVKTDKLTAVGATAHSITVTGLDLATTKKSLEAIRKTTLTELAFATKAFATNTVLTQTIMTEMGIVTPTIGDGVEVKLAKAAGSKQVDYTLTKANQTSQTLSVVFNAFSPGPTQAEVNAEQTTINALGGAKRLDTTSTIALASNVTFDSIVATRFGLTGFVARANFTYLYSHPALNTDGQLSLTILVKTDQFTSTNAVPHIIEVTGLVDAANAQAILDTVDATKIGNLDKTKLPSDSANANPTINGVTGAIISNKTPKDEENAYELEISVSVNGKTFKKIIIISGFPQTPNQINALAEQGASADTQQKWEAYVELLEWASDDDKQQAKVAIDWSGNNPIVKEYGFSRILNALFPNGFNIPSTTTSIGTNAFSYRNIPKTFVLPSSLLTIGRGSFYETTLPESFALPSTITNIPNEAFKFAKVASNFRLPSSIKTIGEESFTKVELPEGFVIPSSVESISQWAFSYAKLPNGFIIPSSVNLDNIFPPFYNANIGNLRWVYLDANGQPDATRLAPGPAAGTALVV